MTDIEKRAHDLAVNLLPIALKELDFPIYQFDEKDIGCVNSSNIVETYQELYQTFIKDLPE